MKNFSCLFWAFSCFAKRLCAIMLAQNRFKLHLDFFHFLGFTRLFWRVVVVLPGARSFPKQRLLDQLSLPWKNVTNISRTMRQWGGRRVNGGDGARARQEFASGPILPPPHLPASGNTATARGNCTPTLPWLGSFRIIQWCPKWLAKATFPVQSTIVNINLDVLGN